MHSLQFLKGPFVGFDLFSGSWLQSYSARSDTLSKIPYKILPALPPIVHKLSPALVLFWVRTEEQHLCSAQEVFSKNTSCYSYDLQPLLTGSTILLCALTLKCCTSLIHLTVLCWQISKIPNAPFLQVHRCTVHQSGSGFITTMVTQPLSGRLACCFMTWCVGTSPSKMLKTSWEDRFTSDAKSPQVRRSDICSGTFHIDLRAPCLLSMVFAAVYYLPLPFFRLHVFLSQSARSWLAGVWASSLLNGQPWSRSSSTPGWLAATVSRKTTSSFMPLQLTLPRPLPPQTSRAPDWSTGHCQGAWLALDW